MLAFEVSATAIGPLVEQGTPAVFSVGLTVTPSAPVTVTVTSSLPASVMAQFQGASSTCTLGAKGDLCTVTVTAVNDANGVGETATITLADLAPPAGAPMRPIAARTVTVSTADDDTQGLIVSAAGSTLTIHERAPSNTATFTVRLQTQPAGSTTVMLSATPSAVDGIAISPSTLTFTPADYNVSQTVMITGVTDLDLRTDSFSIRVLAPSLGVPDQLVSVSELDDDTQSIVISRITALHTCPTTGTDYAGALNAVSEGGVEEFCVNLRFQPLSNTALSDAVSPSIAVRTSPALSFSTTAGAAGGYDRPQLVTLSIATDGDAMNEAGVVNLTAPGVAARSVMFTIVDPDVQALVFSGTNDPGPGPDAGTIFAPRGTILTSVGIALAFDPVSTTLVSCSSSSPALVILSGGLPMTGGPNGTWKTFRPIMFQTDPGAFSQTVQITCSGSTIPARVITVVIV